MTVERPVLVEKRADNKKGAPAGFPCHHFDLILSFSPDHPGPIRSPYGMQPPRNPRMVSLTPSQILIRVLWGRSWPSVGMRAYAAGHDAAVGSTRSQPSCALPRHSQAAGRIFLL